MPRVPLDTDRLHAALGARWNRVEVVTETGSTNVDLLSDVAAPDRSVLAADNQTAARGRLDRTWSSPPMAGLAVSVLLRPPVTLARWGWLPLLTGVAVVDALAATTDVDIALKWPNDVLAVSDERKLVGILAQTAGDAVVVGIGVNVSLTADELPVDTATSLTLLGAADPDRTSLLVAVLTALDSLYSSWVDCDGDAEACGLAAAYRSRCLTLGREVRVTLTEAAGDETVVGEAYGLDELGRLLVRTSDGTRTIGAGDVIHLRPA